MRSVPGGLGFADGMGGGGRTGSCGGAGFTVRNGFTTTGDKASGRRPSGGLFVRESRLVNAGTKRMGLSRGEGRRFPLRFVAVELWACAEVTNQPVAIIAPVKTPIVCFIAMLSVRPLQLAPAQSVCRQMVPNFNRARRRCRRQPQGPILFLVSFYPHQFNCTRCRHPPGESRAAVSFCGEAVIRLVLLLARFCHPSRQVNNTRENPAAAMGCSPHLRCSGLHARARGSRPMARASRRMPQLRNARSSMNCCG